MKKNKGITLIALVVTIIVLLILAGVAINLVAGGNGIMAKAQSALIQNNVAEAKERVALRIAEYQTDYYRAVYVEKTVSVNTEMGDWIAQTHQGEILKAGDYEFQITGTGAPYTVTILKNNRIKDDIIGKMSPDGKTQWEDEAVAAQAKSVAKAKTSVVKAVLNYQDEFLEEVYVDQTTSVNANFGDWMADNYGGQELSAGDQTFEISGQAAPYSLKVMKSASLDEEIVGQMTEQGKITWEESGNTNVETTANAQDSVAQANSEYKDEYYKAVYVDQTVSTNVGYGDWLAENYGGQELTAEDYTYQISGEAAPYAVKLNKSGNLTKSSSGQMDSDGNITWMASSSDESEDGTEEPAVKYTVSYDANGGEGSVPADVEYEEGDTVEVDFATVPSKEGYNFVGWAETDNATEATYTEEGTKTFTIGAGNVKLYAVWAEATQYTLTYDATGGTGAPGSVTQYDKNFTLSSTVPTKEGYKFKGWNTKKDGTGTTYAAGANVAIEENTTLYAIWELSAGLIAWYDGINNTANGHDYEAGTWTDLTGRNTQGATLNGCTWMDNGLYFDGNDWVNLNSILMPQTDNFTLECVVSIANKDSDTPILGQTDSSAAASGRINLRYDKDNSELNIFNNNGTNTLTKSGYNPELEEILTISIVKNGNIQLWINGTKVGEQDKTGVNIYQGNTILGRPGMYATAYLKGKIFSVKAYDEALPAQAMKENYNSNKERFVNEYPENNQYSGYVWNGLTNWYDGIENWPGLGYHNYGAKTWDDQMGNATSATISGAVWKHNGLYFDGNDYVDMNTILMPEDDNFTLEFVVSLSDKSAIRYIAGQNNSGANAKYRLGLRYNSTNSQLGFFNNDGSSSSNVESGYNPELEEKVNVTIMKNNNMQIWINGAMASEQAKTGVKIYQSETNLGRCGWYAASYFKGTIYSVRKYNRALTSQEMQNNYNVDKLRFEM